MKFKYKAYNRKGKVVKGEVEAGNRREALNDLKSSELRIIKIDIVKDGLSKKIVKSASGLAVTLKEKIMGKKLANKRLESFKEEMEYMGYESEDFRRAVNGINILEFDARKYKKEFNLTDIQVDKIMSGRLNKKEEKSNVKGVQSKFDRIQLFSRVSRGDLITFTEQLSIMISTDIELIEALEAIQLNMKNKRFIRIIDEIIYDLTKGKELSSAMESHPKVFNTLYVAMVRVGESTGSELHKSLDDLVKYLKMSLKIRREFTKAMIYPAFVVAALIGLIVFVNYYVMPRFKTLFADNDFEMPFLTQLIFSVSENMGLIFIVLSMFIVVMSVMLWSIDSFRNYCKSKIDYLSLKFPVVRGAYTSSAMYQITMTISITLSNGISITDSLNLVSNIIKNKYVKKDISDIYYNLEKGKDISEAFGDREYIDSIVKMAVSSGEKSGRLDETLNRVSVYYEEELDSKLNNLIQFMIPVSILMLGLVTMPFIIGLYLPIMSMTDQLGNIR